VKAKEIKIRKKENRAHKMRKINHRKVKKKNSMEILAIQGKV
jgi:hypothetical protein